MKKTVLLTLILVAFVAAPAFAAVPYVLPAGGGVNTGQYHSYDGLICTDCHTLHNSEGGQGLTGNKAQTEWTSGPYRELLKKGDWTDICLSCHKEGYNTSASADMVGVTNGGWVAPIVMTQSGTPLDPTVSMPAGDFYYSNLDPKKGHNPAFTKGAAGGAATSKLMAPDTVLGSTPPGGSITDGEWSCHSCHGMHARFSGGYTAYRQIKRKVNGIVQTADVSGYGVETKAGDYTLAQQAAGYEPLLSNSRGDIQGTSYVNKRKDGNDLEGADLFAPYGDTNKNVYRGGFSSFCSTCHGLFHGGTEGPNRSSSTGNTGNGTAWLRHPTSLALKDAAAKKADGTSKYGIASYNAVVTNQQATNPNTPGYDFKYPLVKAETTNFTLFKSTVASLGTATTVTDDDRIMCLTCHQAHASPFANMTRWDATGHAFLPVGANEKGAIVGGADAPTTGDNPAFGCGKCHQKGGTAAFVKTGF